MRSRREGGTAGHPIRRRLAVALTLAWTLASCTSGQGGTPAGGDTTPALAEPTATEDLADDLQAEGTAEPAVPGDAVDGEHGGQADPGAAASVDDWDRGAAAPLALTEVAGAGFGGTAWTAGGLDADGRAVAVVQIYDPTFDAWQEGPALPTAVHHSALVGAGDRLYLVGGYVGPTFDAPTAEVFVLDAATGAWQPAPSLPQPRAAGAAAWDGERLVYGGGVGPDGLAGDVWALEGGDWTPVGALSQAREHLAAAGDGDGRVWFLGGRTGGFDTNLATVDLVEGGEVTAVGELPTARGGLSGFYAGAGTGACAVGGEATGGTFANVECVDAAGAVTVLPDLGVARHGLGAVAVEGLAVVLLGGPEPGLSTSDVVEILSVPPRR